MPNMNMNNRKSPVKQHRIKHSHSIPVTNSNNGRMRSNSSMASSYPRMYNNNNNNNHYYNYHHYSNSTSPTAMSASSLPAVPLFYSNTYADPPECSSLPKPPESWYLPLSSVDNLPVKIEEEKEKEKENENEHENVNLNLNEKELITTPIKQKSFTSPIQYSKQNFSRTCYYTHNNQGFYSPYYSSTTTSSYQKFPTQYISVKA
ncbi:unnamed protein product [Rotaria sordida]|uniref:Uncharacterized protein n=1 Tax=Rotaria sordida TaxID=392033 RepID=A0A815HTB0_9BILA|nr:unnamed protein product [Rotaria sordida]CAF1002559.1 unnamed protein product [Rotaria sordida]CAF1195978.1 unnamed protein product [Rotaria sordida]CAF1357846.1 unnamed protein product [Rotaria sordida]CAF1358311.1 unnamed protein product [Rotaria sordida]